ncbi:RNA polymerase sigma factor [Shewanella cyperi]|uniref:RNA polymerase sigma factor n=1 Tax=Shewanella cyperi TaxID=2814292 RepID=UPI001A950129|nr:sigma-70 family RNA polymerase sigma factor [Shewanella cyperi]QSX40887.1 sigma-70 family RNA polymerase sigma factor [Shewanella cyperi]
MATTLIQAQIELWVLEAQAGDMDALARLYQHFTPQVMGFVLKKTANTSLAQDAVQEAWIKLSKRLSRLDDPAAFKSWLFQLAHWQVLDMAKQNARYAPAIEEQPQAQDTRAVDVADALTRLGTTEQEIIHLFYLEGFSLAEIGRILAIPTGTVKSRLFRARKQLEQLLN